MSDKLRIIQFAEQNGNRAAEREFSVSESNVRLWRKSKENLEKMPRLKRANRGKKAAWPELEIDLLEWITEKRNNGLAILPSLVRLKALELAKDEKYNILEGQSRLEITGVNASRRGMLCHRRQKTTLAQHLPADYEKIVTFHRFIIGRRKEHSYPLHLIANMDETPLTFEMPPNRMINNTGEKTIKIRTTGNEKNRVSRIGVLRGWFKNKADGHLQEKTCSEDQQPTRSRCFSPAERMDGFRADEGLDRESTPDLLKIYRI